MKVLLDHCVDWRLARSLPGHEVKSAQEVGWERLKNGALLRAAADAGLDAFPIATVGLVARTNRLVDLLPLVPRLAEALDSLRPGQFVEIHYQDVESPGSDDDRPYNQ